MLVVHDGGLETMNLLHKSQFSRVHRPIKLNLTDHRRGAICLRRIDVDAEEKWGSTFRYNCCFRQTADAIHCISSMSLFSFFLFFSRIFVKDFVPQKHPRIPRRKHRIAKDCKTSFSLPPSRARYAIVTETRSLVVSTRFHEFHQRAHYAAN